MKKLAALLLILIWVFGATGCGSKLLKGSEKQFVGTVMDRGMSVVHEGDRSGRPYIIILTDDHTEICFWLYQDLESQAKIGDHVTIESAIDELTNLLVATRIAVE